MNHYWKDLIYLLIYKDNDMAYFDRKNLKVEICNMIFNDSYVEIYLKDTQKIFTFPDHASAKAKLKELFKAGYGIAKTARIKDVSEHLWICLDVIYKGS